MIEIEKFGLETPLRYFPDVSKLYLGKPKMKELEDIFKPLKDGEETFSLKHLKILIDKENRYWKFLDWWRMPAIKKKEIEDIEHIFENLQHKDKLVIEELFKRLKNIEIVSCILRFVDPNNYGILSSPVECLLYVKGKEPIEKYLLYLENLDELKNEYQFTRIADVDMALWTLARILYSSSLKDVPKYKKIYDLYRNKPNALKRIMARNALEHIWEEKSYVHISDLFLETDYIIAGIIAGRGLEHFVKKLCRENDIPLLKRDINGSEKKVSIKKLANELASGRYITKEEKFSIYNWWEIRCDLAHEFKMKSTSNEVEKMIEGINIFINKHS